MDASKEKDLGTIIGNFQDVTGKDKRDSKRVYYIKSNGEVWSSPRKGLGSKTKEGREKEKQYEGTIPPNAFKRLLGIDLSEFRRYFRWIDKNGYIRAKPMGKPGWDRAHQVKAERFQAKQKKEMEQNLAKYTYNTPFVPAPALERFRRVRKRHKKKGHGLTVTRKI